MTIYKRDGNITHITLSIGKYWISFDKSGIMAWDGKRNYYFIF